MLPTRIPGLLAAGTEVLHLGAVLGESDALGHVKAVCAAARALLFKRVKEEETYKRFKMTWEEFCPNVRYLANSSATPELPIEPSPIFGHLAVLAADLSPMLGIRRPVADYGWPSANQITKSVIGGVPPSCRILAAF